MGLLASGRYLMSQTGSADVRRIFRPDSDYPRSDGITIAIAKEENGAWTVHEMRYRHKRQRLTEQAFHSPEDVLEWVAKQKL